MLSKTNPLVFKAQASTFSIVSNSIAPTISYSPDSPAGLVIAVNTFADDIKRVSGIRPEVSSDALVDLSKPSIYIGTVNSSLIIGLQDELLEGGPDIANTWDGLRGKWESFDIRAKPAVGSCGDRLVITGSDMRGTIYALYTLSSYMGVSPWYWFADVHITPQSHISLPFSTVISHGPPTVKYRGFFLNDEQPVLWNWAREHWKIADGEPPFQVGMYEKVFELCLRLKGNYMWPAMWSSMFAVDGQDVSSGLPSKPTPGPNQALASKMGIVMGTSHHEPMSRNQKEYTDFGEGEWDYTKNGKWLREFWEYGARRVKEGGCETVFTVGMRGDGDMELGGASIELLEKITADQQEILKRVLDKVDLDDVPQMWAMYKEVMGFFANGLKVPKEVTPLLADDNWGNLMAVMPEGSTHQAGGGIYYHADYVGDPRDYKWINTVPLAKMWEQLNVARTFRTTEIWILNAGDLKLLETPVEYFLDVAYDSDRWGRGSLLEWLGLRAKRDFGVDDVVAEDIAKIMAEYSILASRRKAELVDDKTYSIVTYNELERVLAQWDDLESRAEKIFRTLPEGRQLPYYEMVLVAIRLQANLHHLYESVAKSNLYATQGRSAANLHADRALALFERDDEITDDFHKLEGGKWNHTLSQSHIGYQYWQAPSRQSCPPTSRVSTRTSAYDHGLPVHTRYTVEDCLGAWPGDNKHNTPLGYNAPDPTLFPMDKYGAARWVDVGSGGPKSVHFTATPREEWVIVSQRKGNLTPDGKNDVRVWLSIDWQKVKSDDVAGHVDFVSSDGAKCTVTLPLKHVEAPPEGYKGSIEGDGYVAIEAGKYQSLTPGAGKSWEEIPYYGRTRSGMAVFPVGDFYLLPGTGPSITYNFFLTSTPTHPKLPVTLHIGPALNYILGKRLTFGVQLDGGEIKVVEPIPEAEMGSLPHDWEGVVADEIRVVDVELELGESGRKGGEHKLRIWGITTGIVLERVLIDLGGISARGKSYLGPPESVIIQID